MIDRCVFHNNSATEQGGAICNLGGHPVLLSTVFVANHCANYGGAICNRGTKSYQDAYLTASNCLFVGNFVSNSSARGGAISNLYRIHYAVTYVSIRNSTFFANTAVDLAGGVYTDHGNSTNTLKNCILYGNSDTSGGNYSESAQIHGGTNTVEYSCIQGLDTYAGNGNIGDDPKFMDPLGPDWIAGTLDDDLRLDLDSPCIDAGDSNAVPEDIITDIEGRNRFIDYPHAPDTGTGTTPLVDMGAYEVCPLEWWAYEDTPIQPQACADWQHLGRPSCWCAPYQGDGDADCASSGFPGRHRVYLGDLNMIVENWQKRIDDPDFNPCADIDHEDSGFPGRFRVYLKDLNIVINNWQKRDEDLPGDCPRAQ